MNTPGSRFEEARALIERATVDFTVNDYGPAHVVIGDYNLEDYWIDQAIAEFEGRAFDPDLGYTPGDDECRDTLALLRALKVIPEDERCPVDE